MSEIRSGATPDGRITYLAAGPEDGSPLLFLHGIGGGARLWTRQLEAFGARYRAIAWNMPGYGGSANLPAVSVGLLGDVLAAFVAALGLDRPVLVGHSLGGMVVQSALADGLVSPRAVVLAQTSAAFGGRDPAWAKAFVAERLGPLERGASMTTLADESVAAMVGSDADPAGVALAREVIGETPPAAYRESTLAMIGFDRREALDRIAVPTLVLAGSRDSNVPPATMDKMAARIPGARHVCEEGAGHLLMLERPAAFNAALGGFLAELERAPGGAA